MLDSQLRFANKNEDLSRVCQTLCLLEQKVQNVFLSYQMYRFEDFEVGQKQIPNLPFILFSEFFPI